MLVVDGRVEPHQHHDRHDLQDEARSLGFTMGGIALLILVLAVTARPGARAIILSATLVLLTSLAQSLLAGLGANHAIYGSLHALDGLLILGIAGYLYIRTRQRHS